MGTSTRPTVRSGRVADLPLYTERDFIQEEFLFGWSEAINFHEPSPTALVESSVLRPLTRSDFVLSGLWSSRLHDNRDFAVVERHRSSRSKREDGECQSQHQPDNGTLQLDDHGHFLV